MKLKVPSGKYILAVSGGVDSMVLLDILAKQAKSQKPKAQSQSKSDSFQLSASSLQLVVAHFNHNIRKDSVKDEVLVKRAAARYGQVFEAAGANLGQKASEELARQARYSFLRQLQAKYRAKAIITAHHQDDMIETALINLIRGTNRTGLSAIINNKQILRPLLGVAKAEIKVYAQKHKIEWSDDPTNESTDYLRNYLRLKVLTNLKVSQKQVLISNVEKVAKTNIEIDRYIATISHYLGNNDISRQLFSALPADVSKEVLAYRFRQAEVDDFDSKMINRLNMAIRTSKANSTQPVKQKLTLKISTHSVRFVTP